MLSFKQLVKINEIRHSEELGTFLAFIEKTEIIEKPKREAKKSTSENPNILFRTLSTFGYKDTIN